MLHRMSPVILLVSDGNADSLADEFGRYQRDYDVRVARSSHQAVATTTDPGCRAAGSGAGQTSAVVGCGVRAWV